MIRIYYANFTNKLPSSLFEKYLTRLPIELQVKNKSFIRWQDKQLHLFGKLLLIEALKYWEISHVELNHISYNESNRPILINCQDIDFNITHSETLAVCAISRSCKVGIDTEKVKPIELLEFKNIFTYSEWRHISTAPNPLLRFYNLWVRKESLIKADGRGLTIPLKDIDVIQNQVLLDHNVWYLKNILLQKGHCTCLASSSKDINPSLFQIELS